MAIFTKPTAAALTERLGTVLRELNDARAKRTGLIAVAEDDAAYAKLATMEGQIAALTAKETRIRGEIAQAVERERLVEVAKAYDAATTISDRETLAGAELRKLIAGVWPAVRKLIELDDAFRAAIPVKPMDWDEHAFTRDLMSLILNQWYIDSGGRLRGSAGLIQSPYELSQNPLNTIEGALREHLALAFKGRPNPQTSVTGDALAE